MSAGTRPARAWPSFWRIVDVPFGTCVAALESWQLSGHDGGRRGGQGLVRGPVEHDQDCGTCRVQVHLARGPLRPVLRMRLEADHWSSSPPRTALELIPCGHVRPSAAYFRAGRSAAGLAGPLAGTAHAGAAPGPRRRQTATRGSGPTRAGQVAWPDQPPRPARYRVWQCLAAAQGRSRCGRLGVGLSFAGQLEHLAFTRSEPEWMRPGRSARAADTNRAPIWRARPAVALAPSSSRRRSASRSSSSSDESSGASAAAGREPSSSHARAAAAC